MGHLLGGWTIAPVFTAGSGLPITFGTINGGGQAFGEGDSVNFFGYGFRRMPFRSNHPTAPVRVTSFTAASVGTDGVDGANMFADPAAAYATTSASRSLGTIPTTAASAFLRGLPYWNVDLSVKKMFKITERFSAELRSSSPTSSTTTSSATRLPPLAQAARRLILVLHPVSDRCRAQ